MTLNLYCKIIRTYAAIIEIFKALWLSCLKNELAPPIMDSMFERRIESCNLRNFQEFLTERKRIVHYNPETLSYQSLELWSLLTESILEYQFLSRK